MPTLNWNKTTWQVGYDWNARGDEWSRAWGSAEAQWFGSLYPRVQAFLPAANVLELAPGFGRWTQYLKDVSQHLTLVDLSETCIDYCRQRFADEQHLEYFTNDGTSLAMIPDDSLDFVFSFDSLVHVEAEVVDAYLAQLARKMKRDAVGFIHHSNIKPWRNVFKIQQHLRPTALRETVLKQRFDFWDHHRAYSMSAALFEKMCRSHGLQCISQELVNWGGPLPIDAMSVFTPVGSAWARPNRVLTNVGFMREASYIARVSQLYARQAPAGSDRH